MNELILKEECDRIIGACFKVYKEKGCGLLEDVNQESPGLEFEDRVIPFEEQKSLPLSYKGRPLKKIDRSDFCGIDQVIVEIKAVDNLVGEHRALVLNYLEPTGAKLGMRGNFGPNPKSEWARLVQ